jgi:hypothetical protein
MAVLLSYGTARVLLGGDAGASEEYRCAANTRGLIRLSGFRSTKSPDLRFRALLTDGSSELELVRA